MFSFKWHKAFKCLTYVIKKILEHLSDSFYLVVSLFLFGDYVNFWKITKKFKLYLEETWLAIIITVR